MKNTLLKIKGAKVISKKAQTAIAADRLTPEATYLFVVRRDDSVRKMLHNTLGLVCLSYCGYVVYKQMQ